MNVIFRGPRKTNTSVHHDELLCIPRKYKTLFAETAETEYVVR